jgi:hypothetical protein
VAVQVLNLEHQRKHVQDVAVQVRLQLSREHHSERSRAFHLVQIVMELVKLSKLHVKNVAELEE